MLQYACVPCRSMLGLLPPHVSSDMGLTLRLFEPSLHHHSFHVPVGTLSAAFGHTIGRGREQCLSWSCMDSSASSFSGDTRSG